mmetsp:Transcript_81209/g.263236  ORF Transcript_81209/g.263236 Transcript_81209/m.263236 type:complete len:109 (+) Transcript_81209:240-566(+)
MKFRGSKLAASVKAPHNAAFATPPFVLRKTVATGSITTVAPVAAAALAAAAAPPAEAAAAAVEPHKEMRHLQQMYQVARAGAMQGGKVIDRKTARRLAKTLQTQQQKR